MTPAARIARLEEQVTELRRDVNALYAEVISGESIAPRLPMRSRLHNLESSEAAARAAEHALAAMRAERRATGAERGQRTGLYITGFNVLVAVAAVLVTVLGR